jgi:hypothetical protein
MWTNDVGRRNAGNYNLLRVLFEVNLMLFGKKPKKKILFVLRDFSTRHDGEKITQRIINDISEIWKQIHKPEALINTVADNFFDFEFVLLPNMFDAEEKFNEEVTKLRTRFYRRASNSLFLEDSHSKEIPMDGLPAFIQ